jgi:3D (Asp-Asp-Asp) domain-containing protein
MRKLTDPFPIRTLWVLVLVSMVFVASPQAVAWAEVKNTNQKEKIEFRVDSKEGEFVQSIHSQTLIYAYNPDTKELKKESTLNRKPVRRLAEKPRVQNVAQPSVQSNPTGDKRLFTAVAYTSSVNETDADPFTTAAGTQTRWGIIATNVLPMGTKVKISGFGDQVFVVEDRMNARYNGTNTLDIWHPTKTEAYQWGRRQVEIEIVE